ncbi:hypothetical protein ACG7TL_004214 [Trametes sanguinea]
MVEFYDVAVQPETPLRTGMRVEIFLVDPCDGMFPANEEGTRFIATSSGVVGTILAARPVEGKIIELTVKNEAEVSEVAFAHLALEHEQGVTATLSLRERLLAKAVALASPATRSIGTERKAVVYRSGRRHWMAGPA